MNIFLLVCEVVEWASANLELNAAFLNLHLGSSTCFQAIWDTYQFAAVFFHIFYVPLFLLFWV